MRKELYGPLPLILGVAIVALSVLTPDRAPPTGCSCPAPIYTPAAFEALDASGYAGVSVGYPLYVDGLVVEVSPSPLVFSPYRLVRLEGSSIRFNVTAYNAATGPVGTWVRLHALNTGESESAGPATGHRWSHEGKTAPPGTSVVPLAGVAFGLAVAAWGALSWKEYGRSAKRAGELGTRLAEMRALQASNPAARAAEGVREEISAAGKMLRRGQYDSAALALEGPERQLARANALSLRVDAARRLAADEVGRGFNGAGVEGVLAEAARESAAGAVSAGEKLVSEAEAALAGLPRLRELIAAAESSLAANETAGVEDPETLAALGDSRALLAEGRVEAALEAATRAVARARAVSPPAQSASAELARLQDLLQLRPELDRTREVRDRVRDADELYRLGQFDRARAEAKVGLWLADANELGHAGFEAIARAHFAAQGYALDPAEGPRPPVGFRASKEGEVLLVVTSTWRDFPGERILFAVKDFLAEGGASRAVVYSSAFTDTSTDPRIQVVDANGLVEVLRAAALHAVAGAAPSG